MRKSVLNGRAAIFLAGLLIAALPATMSAAQDAKDVPVPSVRGPVAPTHESPIWGHSWKIDLNNAGYAEEEYFISGKSNVYEYAPNNKDLKVRSPDVPYTTRLLVRRPVNPAKFSGNVIVEIINMSRGWDLDVMWQMQHEYIMRNGDAYIGVTSKPNAIRALKQFDARRYASLSFPNPIPLDDARNCTTIPRDSARDTENGLIWDVFSQVGALLKSNVPGRPLHQLHVKYVYAVGYSQSGGFLRTYLNGFEPTATANGKPVYDGYLVGAGSLPTPINQCATAFKPGDPRSIVPHTKVPAMVVMTNSDYIWQFPVRRADDEHYREYDSAGGSHGYTYPGSFEPSVEEIKKAGFDNRYEYNCVAPRVGSDFPDHYIFDTALKDLDLWARGKAPPPSRLIDTVPDASSAKYADPARPGSPTLAISKLDQYGNTMGGIRTPYVDVPTATYHPDFSDPNVCAMSKTPFDREQLLKLYPTHQDYVNKVTADAERLVKEGWLLPDDADKIIAQAENAIVP